MKVDVRQETGSVNMPRLAIKIGLVAVSCLVMFLTLRVDTNPVGLRFQAAMDVYRHKPGTLNGFFAWEDDKDSCFELKQSGGIFETVRLSNLEAQKLMSIKGKFDESSNSGRMYCQVPSNSEPIPFTRFQLATDESGGDVLELIDTQGDTTSLKYQRVSRYDCHFNEKQAICLGSRDKEIDPALVISPQEDDCIVGAYTSSRRGSRIVFEKNGENSYNVTKMGPYVSVIMREIDIYFTKRDKHGMLDANLKVVTRLGKIIEGRIRWNLRTKQLQFFNCDGRPIPLIFTKSEDVKLEGKAEL